MKSEKKKSAEAEIADVAKKSNKNLFAIAGVILVLALAAVGYWWYSQPKKPIDHTKITVGTAKSPTEAYQMLFAAVKSKDTAKIKQMMSENSLAFAEFVSGQQKKTLDEVLVNGFTATTFSETMPQMRDERIKDNFGALEVLNPQKQWEDLPFILENGGWKLAIGDAFKGSYQKPGLGQSMREQEAANAANNTMIPANVGNTNNANVEMIVPKLSNDAQNMIPRNTQPKMPVNKQPVNANVNGAVNK